MKAKSGRIPMAHLARRQFVKAAAAAIATARFPILGANDRINVGQVGVGSRGRDHLNFYSSLDSDCPIAPIADANHSAREPAVAPVHNLNAPAPNTYPDTPPL